MAKKKVKKRRKAPRGSGLSWDPRREKWLWRRVDKRTGRRRVRSTDQRRLDLAMRVAARFDDELAQEQAGLKVYDCWRLELEPLVARWQSHQASSARAAELKAKRVRRALELLKLRTAADLADVAKLDDRLRALEGRQLGRMTVSRARLRDSFQNPLKAFSRWLAGNGRHLPHDPLAVWEPMLRAKSTGSWFTKATDLRIHAGSSAPSGTGAPGRGRRPKAQLVRNHHRINAAIHCFHLVCIRHNLGDLSCVRL